MVATFLESGEGIDGTTLSPSTMDSALFSLGLLAGLLSLTHKLFV